MAIKKENLKSIKKRKAQDGQESVADCADLKRLKMRSVLSNEHDERGEEFDRTKIDEEPKHEIDRKRDLDHLPKEDGHAVSKSDSKLQRQIKTPCNTHNDRVKMEDTYPTGEIEDFVSPISIKSLGRGDSLLGRVKEVNEFELLISLPHGLLGTVALAEMSNLIAEKTQKALEDEGNLYDVPDPSEHFYPGQIVTCSVLDIAPRVEGSKKHRIHLSLRPDIVNRGISPENLQMEGTCLSAEIKSIEDYGYTLDAGIKGTRPFLYFKNSVCHVSDYEGKFLLKEGSIVMCCITKDNNSGVPSFSLYPRKEADLENGMIIDTDSTLNFENLKSGALVKVRIRRIMESSGAFLQILDVIGARALRIHLLDGDSSDNKSKLSDMYEIGRTYLARILWTSNKSRNVHVSLKNNVIYSYPTSHMDESLGKIYDDLKVVDFYQGYGALVRNQPGDTLLAHITHMGNGKRDNKLDCSAIGSIRKGRVIGCDMIEDIRRVSFDESVINSPFVRLSELKPGSLLRGTVIRLEQFGAIVSLGLGVRALCLKSHFLDAPVTRSGKKVLYEGREYNFMILSIDYKLRKVLLTHKKTLIQSDLTKVQDYDISYLNKWTLGTIVSIKEYGIIVEFFNGVKGLVPLKEIDSFDGSDAIDFKKLSQMFTVNQLIKCKVIYANSEERKIALTLKVSQADKLADGKDAAGSSNPPSARYKLQIGHLVSGSVVDKTDDNECLVSVNVNNQDILATISKPHLSDYESLNNIMWNSIQKGDHLSNMAVLRFDVNKGHHIMTKKASMINSLKEYGSEEAPLQMSNFHSFIKVGQTLAGYVKEIHSRKCIISFWNNSFGILGASDISDKYVIDLNATFSEGQSVVTTVKKVTTDPSAVFLSISKENLALGEPEDKFLVRNLKNFLTLRDNYALVNAPPDKNLPKVGSLVRATISKITGSETLLELENNLCGLLWREGDPQSANVGIGDVVEGFVIDRTPSANVVDIIEMDTNVLTKTSRAYSSKKFRSKLKKKVEENRVVDAIKIASKNNLGIFRVPKLDNAFVYAWLCTTPNSCFGKVTKDMENKTKFRVSLHEIDENGRILGAVRPKQSIEEGSVQEIIDPVDPKLKVITDIKRGMILKFRIMSIKKTQINLYLAQNLRGRLHVLEIYDHLEDCKNPEKPFDAFKVNQILEAKVIGFHNSKSHRYLPFSHTLFSSVTVVDFTMKPSEMALPELALTNGLPRPTLIPVGTKLMGYVELLKRNHAVVRISRHFTASLSLLRASTDSKDIVEGSKILRPNVLSHYWIDNSEDHSISLSGFDPSERPIPTIETLTVGDELVGVVVKISPVFGLVLRLSSTLYGRVHLTDIGNYICETPTSAFNCGQYLNCEVIFLHKEKSMIDLSLRKYNVDDTDTSPDGMHSKTRYSTINSIDDIRVGKVCAGYIIKLQKDFALVELCRKVIARLALDNYSTQANKYTHLKDGSMVVGIITKMRQDKSRIYMALGDNMSADIYPHCEEIIAKGSVVEGTITTVEDTCIKVKIDGIPIPGKAELSGLGLDPGFDLKCYYNTGDRIKALVTKLHNGYVFLTLKSEELDNAYPKNKASSELECNTNEEPFELDIGSRPLILGATERASEEEQCLNIETNDKEASKRNINESSDSFVRKKKGRLEDGLEIKENSLHSELDPNVNRSFDFERLLLTYPNSSYLWIKYIAFQLSLSDIEKARAIVEMALDKINFREEDERLNIWISWMNLENAYGTKETFNNVVSRAALQVNPKKIYFLAANVLVKSNKYDDAEAIYSISLKKFKRSYKVWRSYMMYQMKRGLHNDARATLQRCIESLPKHKHIKTISSFAQMEFKFGDPERGRTMFEGILNTYPTRMDIWSVYTDMEMKIKNFDSARRLFNRIVAMKISSKRMKFALKKYINFEIAHGTPQGVENVKNIAIGYLEKSSV